jgi:putative endopeptidase
VGQLLRGPASSPRTKGATRSHQRDLRRLADRIRNLDWMSEPTKQRALGSLAAVTQGGYPQKWKDYSGHDVERIPS